MARAAVTRLSALVILLGASTALAAAPIRLTGVARKSGKLVVSVGLQDLFGPRDVERLLSGFTTRVLIRVALVREDSNEAVAQAARWSEIVYDLWDEKLRVRISADRADRPQVFEVRSGQAALDIATKLVEFPLAEVDKLDEAALYHVSLRADLNPVSEELVSNVRRWLSRPGGRAGSGESFFGSFVSVFVNPHIEDSERMLGLVSQSFQLPRESSARGSR